MWGGVEVIEQIIYLTHLTYRGSLLWIVSSTLILVVCGRKKARPLWQLMLFAGLWTIWLERNWQTSNNQSLLDMFIWEKMNFMASLWDKALTILYKSWDVIVMWSVIFSLLSNFYSVLFFLFCFSWITYPSFSL